MTYIQLTETVGQIEEKINAALAEDINLLLSKKKARIEGKCKALVSNWISWTSCRGYKRTDGSSQRSVDTA